jgi:hypothetical protein
MARFRKVDCRIWNDARFNALSERGKLVFLFLLTHPGMTMVGAMRATEAGLAAELGIPIEGFAEAFREVLSKGIAKHDPKASFLWLPNFTKYNRPESPNVVKAWPDAFDLVPECGLKYQLFEKLKAFSGGLSKGFQEAFVEAFTEDFAKGMPNQEPEPEPELEQERAASVRPNITQAAAAKTKNQSRAIRAATSAFVLPDWLPLDSWIAYLEMRRDKRKNPTERAKELVVRELDKLRASGQDPALVLDQSTRNGWTDVYAMKGSNGNGATTHAKLSPGAARFKANEEANERATRAVAKRFGIDSEDDGELPEPAA